jgi:oxalate decarboxylase/phosphoglucose isomerase-like protein (cupin superfamily)
MLARVALAGLLLSLSAAAQPEQSKVFYFPKPVARTVYQPPMKPVTRLADLKAKHQGETQWRELVIDDGNSKAHMVQEAPGAKHARRLYPDSPAWWAVIQGRIRFEIEKTAGGFEVFEARKGSYVFVPERLIHSLEVVGDEPAIRFEVTLYEATPVFEKKPSGPGDGLVEYIPVRLSTGLNPLDVPDPEGEPWPYHVNVYDLAKQNEGKPRWSRPAMRKNRVRGNFICGLASAEPPLDPGNRGHFHADFAEFWVVMLGELRWIFEGDPETAIIAGQGDIVYAPPKTFHLPQFHGKEGLNCRLTSSTFPSANHLFDAEQ